MQSAIWFAIAINLVFARLFLLKVNNGDRAPSSSLVCSSKTTSAIPRGKYRKCKALIANTLVVKKYKAQALLNVAQRDNCFPLKVSENISVFPYNTV
jgi:hypothetical protein